MSIFKKPTRPKSPSSKKNNIPEGLWISCPITKDLLYKEELEKNGMVAPKSGHHFPISARQRIAMLTDANSFEEKDSKLSSTDPLEFTDSKPYLERIAAAQRKTGEMDAVLSGLGTIEGIRTSLAVMDFQFNGGSMGSVVGEKITRAVERATELKIPAIIVSASGGARMQEGILSLMQMTKTCAALARHAEARLPYISVLTHPTMAGVMASFASVGDIILAEPKALIGFTGPRVIKETTHQELPEGFQSSEFLLEHGLIDQIVHRHDLKKRIATFLKAFEVKASPTAPETS